MVYRKGESLTETVLGELCVIYGFCLEPNDKAEMVDMPADDLDAWTDAVFRKEGLREPYDKHLWRQVRDHVGRRLRKLD